jgi:formylglycine-generating enzyme required for sulfatase activity
VPARPESDVRDFYIQRKLVTNEDYMEFVKANGYRVDRRDEEWDEEAKEKLPSFVDATGLPGPRSWSNGSFGDPSSAGDPVRGITIDEARAYARWFSRRVDGPFRLPTRAEWEIAAGYDPATRSVRAYPFGDVFDASSLASGAKEPPGAGKGMKGRSPLGLLDLTGNLRQWVESSSRDPATKGSDFAATEDEARELARVRHTERARARAPEEQKSLLLRTGFRLVRDLDH